MRRRTAQNAAMGHTRNADIAREHRTAGDLFKQIRSGRGAGRRMLCHRRSSAVIVGVGAMASEAIAAPAMKGCLARIYFDSLVGVLGDCLNVMMHAQDLDCVV